ncbi:MAG: hypothetical protein HND48_13420 [Chloroflexi bacterium]|nr:hypothetical protein [Chloroflexota bacterium]
MTATAEDIECLLDAIEHLKANERAEARAILRGVIQSNSDFEDAWLWMSLAVDTLDQSAVCLDNALRINPGNARDRSAHAAARHGHRRSRTSRPAEIGSRSSGGNAVAAGRRFAVRGAHHTGYGAGAFRPRRLAHGPSGVATTG